MFHESPAATADMFVLPGVLGCSFDRLRTGSPCDVAFRYGNQSRGTAGRLPGGTPILFALAPLRSVPQAGSQFHGLATAIHEISGLGGSSFFQGTALISSNRKKAATNVFIVRAKIVSADQMNRTGTMITPSNIRRMVTVFSFRLDISLYQLRYKVQGTGYKG
jgi:hypothetical protein